MATYGHNMMDVALTSDQKAEFLASLVFSKDKGGSLGPFLIGLVLNTLFCGVMIVQTIKYLNHAREDRRFNLVLVASTVLIGLAYTVYLISYMMRLFVYGFGLYSSFANLKGLVPFIVLEDVIAVVVQIFYAERTYRLLANTSILNGRIFAAGCLLLMLGEIACNLAIVIFIQQMKATFSAFEARSYVLAWLSLHLVVDVYITLIIGWALLRSKTGWSSTDRLITRLVTFTVETQLPPLIVVLVYLILYTWQTGSSAYYIAVHFAMPLPYVIGMLAVLNVRVSLRDDMETEMSNREQSYAYGKGSNQPQQTTVHISTETYTHSHIHPYHGGINRQDAHHDDSKVDGDSLASSTGKENHGNDSSAHLTGSPGR